MRIELQGITKRFPGVIANDSVDLSVVDGEVHALLGENGAGKSTLMNILFGLYHPDEGAILVDGRPRTFGSPADAIAAGIGMVHQHFMLVPVFTVTENVILGVEPTDRFGRLDREAARRKVVGLSERFGLRVDPDALIEDLPVGIQQRVEILKALYREARCLILDEPTAVLTPQEIDDLIRVIKDLTSSGRSVIFISHKLKEVLAVADRVTVLRGGRVAGETTPAEATPESLAEMMVGRAVQLEVSKEPGNPGSPILEIDEVRALDDRGHTGVDGVTLQVRAGEILALAGVQGNGQTELIEAITGLRRVESGRVVLDGRDVTNAAAADLFELGMAHIPEDRQTDGLVLGFPIEDNLVLNSYKRKPFARGIAVNRPEVTRKAGTLIKEFDIRAPSGSTPAGSLSGGNQQKVIVAREFVNARRLLVASQPTRGLDVGSIQYIHSRIVAKRDEGVAVLLVSTELDEIMALSDRIAVMYRGSIIDTVDRAGANRNQIGLLMAGSRADEETKP